MEPLVVELDVFANGVGGAENAVFGAGAEDADGRRGGFLRDEEAAVDDMQVSDDEIAGIHAIDDGSIELRLGKNLDGLHAFPRGACRDALYTLVAIVLIVVEGKARRELRDLLQRLPIDRLLGFEMRLRTPSCSMKAITFCCAPAPMDSMATTAARQKSFRASSAGNVICEWKDSRCRG